MEYHLPVDLKNILWPFIMTSVMYPPFRDFMKPDNLTDYSFVIYLYVTYPRVSTPIVPMIYFWCFRTNFLILFHIIKILSAHKDHHEWDYLGLFFNYLFIWIIHISTCRIRNERISWLFILLFWFDLISKYVLIGPQLTYRLFW